MADLSQYSDEDLQRMASAASLQSMPDDQLHAMAAQLGAKGQGNGASWYGSDNLANAALFNFGDEIKAGAAAAKEAVTGGLPFGKAYDQALSMYRGAAKQYEVDNPKTALATEIGGAALPIAAGLAIPAIAPEAGAQAASIAGKVAPGIMRRMGESAGIGSAFGAANGLGSGEGDLASRGESAAKGALVGGVVGGALPPAAGIAGWAYGKTAGPIVSKVGDYLQSKIPAMADTFPARKVAEAFSRDGIDPDTVADRMASGGPGTTMYDVGGENVLGLARGTANLPGPQQQAFQDITAARRMERGGKLIDAASESLGDGDFHSSIRSWDAARRADAAPLYDKAFSNSLPISGDVSAFINDPAFKSGIMKGKIMACFSQ